MLLCRKHAERARAERAEGWRVADAAEAEAGVPSMFSFINNTLGGGSEAAALKRRQHGAFATRAEAPSTLHGPVPCPDNKHGTTGEHTPGCFRPAPRFFRVEVCGQLSSHSTLFDRHSRLAALGHCILGISSFSYGLQSPRQCSLIKHHHCSSSACPSHSAKVLTAKTWWANSIP